MPDRYEEGIRALQDTEPPEQWEEIRRRASGGLVVTLDGEGRDRRPRWPTLLGAAAVLVLALGAAGLLLRDGDHVTTQPADDSLTPPIDGPADPSTTAPPSTTESPSTTGPSTTEAVPRFAVCPRTLGLTTTTAPARWSATMRPAEEVLPPDPPAGVDQQFAGAFSGPTTADNVFVIAGLPGLQDDVFTPFPGPVPGRNALIAPFPGGWYMEVAVPHPNGDCWVTLEAIGMARDEAMRFALGLQGR
jgi:hypothetical protein